MKQINYFTNAKGFDHAISIRKRMIKTTREEYRSGNHTLEKAQQIIADIKKSFVEYENAMWIARGY